MNWDWLRLNIVLGEGGVFLIILAEPDSVPFFVTISPWALSLLLAVSFGLLISTLANLIGIAPVNIRTSDCTPSAPDEARTHVCTIGTIQPTTVAARQDLFNQARPEQFGSIPGHSAEANPQFG